MKPPRKQFAHAAEGRFARVIQQFLASEKFTRLAPGTQLNYRRLLLLAEGPLGDVPISIIRPALVQHFLDGIAAVPSRQQNTRVALRAVERWALRLDLVPHPFTTGTEIVGGGDGHRPWSTQQVNCALEHAKPELARVILVAVNTGQRGSDLIRMNWADLEEVDGRMGVNVTQRKTGLQLWIPFTKELERIVATWERRPAPLLLRDDGTPWPTRGLLSSAWQRERDSNPKLAPCRGMALHGLRATACVRLSRLGATTRQVSDMVGLSEPNVSRYCRFSNQRDNAMAAVFMLDGTPMEQGRKKG